jgi:hypothetical protein
VWPILLRLWLELCFEQHRVEQHLVEQHRVEWHLAAWLREEPLHKGVRQRNCQEGHTDN